MTRHRFLYQSIALSLAIALMYCAWALPAWGHTAPSGEFVYPPGCCHSAATNPNGDCAPIPDGTVTAHHDGWHVTLAAGQHPKLKTKGYVAVIPYGQAKVSDDGEFHICLAPEGSHRYCFFAPPPGV
jgi:hypothetical protein